MSLRSSGKRSYSLGHHINREDSEQDPNESKRSILMQSNHKSSRSVSSLKKKRISWGPSKILEFYPSEHLAQIAEDNEQSDNHSSRSRFKQNQNTGEFDVNIFKQNNNQSQNQGQGYRRATGGILKNQNELVNDEGNSSNFNQLQDSKKRYSHLTVMKEYEMPLADLSIDSQNNNSNQMIDQNLISPSQQDVIMMDVDQQQNLQSRQIQEQNLVQFQINSSPIKPQQSQQDKDYELYQKKMNDDPTPRKSDIQQFDKKNSDQGFVNKQNSSMKAVNNYQENQGKTFDLRKSLDQQDKQGSSDVIIYDVSKDQEMTEEQLINLENLVLKQDSNNDQNRKSGAFDDTQILDSNNSLNQTTNQIDQSVHTERQSIFTKLNQSVASVDDNKQKNERNSINQQQQQFQIDTSTSNNMLQHQQFQPNATLPTQIRQRHSLAQPTQKLLQQQVQNPYEYNYNLKLPSGDQIVCNHFQIDQDTLKEVKQLKNVQIQQSLDLMCQIEKTRLSNVMSQAQEIMLKYKLIQEAIQKQEKFEKMRNLIEKAKSEKIQRIQERQKLVISAIEDLELLESLIKIHIDWERTDQKQLFVTMRDFLTIHVRDIDQQQKSIKISLNSKILPQKQLILLLEQVFKKVLMHSLLKIPGDKKQDENGCITVNGKTSDIIQCIYKYTSSFTESLLTFLMTVKLIDFQQKPKPQQALSKPHHAETFIILCSYVIEMRYVFRFRVEMSVGSSISIRLDKQNVQIYNIQENHFNNNENQQQQTNETSQERNAMKQKFSQFLTQFNVAI
eukprot:403344463